MRSPLNLVSVLLQNYTYQLTARPDPSLGKELLKSGLDGPFGDSYPPAFQAHALLTIAFEEKHGGCPHRRHLKVLQVYCKFGATRMQGEVFSGRLPSMTSFIGRQFAW